MTFGAVVGRCEDQWQGMQAVDLQKAAKPAKFRQSLSSLTGSRFVRISPSGLAEACHSRSEAVSALFRKIKIIENSCFRLENGSE